MLEIAYGAAAKRPQVIQLVEALRNLPLTGTLYIGYPVLRIGEDQIPADALLTTQESGVVLFDLSDEPIAPEHSTRLAEIQARQDNLYRALYNKLLKDDELASRRGLAFKIEVVTFIPRPLASENLPDCILANPNNLGEIILSFDSLQHELFKKVNASVQRTRNLRPSLKRRNVRRETSRGGIMKRIDAATSNLDRWQTIGAIEVTDQPQRIRGLAGSGKTIVLALKAVYLHAANKDWRIAVTFQSRALYGQLKEHVRRLSYDTFEDEPDWTKIRVLHGWGGRNDTAVYKEIAIAHGYEPLDFITAKSRFGDNAFAGACEELLQKILTEHDRPIELFDAVLIDEAQDFPSSFFKLVYRVTTAPKRIIWAYDELQNLGEYAMAPPAELFGYDSAGHALVELQNVEGAPQQDIVLPVCYRNTPWALTVAHALGFGVYRAGAMVQMFAETNLWLDVGYEVQSGVLQLGRQVSLKRATNAAPDYFYDTIPKAEAVKCRSFDDDTAQAEWVATEIRRLIDEDELEPRDFLIILTNVVTARSDFTPFMKALDRRNLSSHLAGVTSSRDVLFMENSVAISQIYRAKGNEAPVVFVVNAQYCLTGLELSRKRSTLFTAITRSRAWVNVCGIGDEMNALIAEIQNVHDSDYNLIFRYPTQKEIEQMKVLHRDRDPAEMQRLDRNFSALRMVFEDLKTKKITIDQLPPDLRSLISSLPVEPNDEQ